MQEAIIRIAHQDGKDTVFTWEEILDEMIRELGMDKGDLIEFLNVVQDKIKTL